MHRKDERMRRRVTQTSECLVSPSEHPYQGLLRWRTVRTDFGRSLSRRGIRRSRWRQDRLTRVRPALCSLQSRLPSSRRARGSITAAGNGGAGGLRWGVQGCLPPTLRARLPAFDGANRAGKTSTANLHRGCNDRMGYNPHILAQSQSWLRGSSERARHPCRGRQAGRAPFRAHGQG